MAGEQASSLLRLDPTRKAITRQLSIPGAPGALAQYGHRLWVATGASADHRGGTLRLLASHAPQTIDPGFHFEFLPPTMLGLYPYDWYADFPSPATFFQSLLPYRPILGRPGHYHQVLSRPINQALHAEAQGRGDATALWSAVERLATEQALTVPLVNPRSVELTSQRLHGYEYHPLWGFLPAQSTITH